MSDNLVDMVNVFYTDIELRREESSNTYILYNIKECYEYKIPTRYILERELFSLCDIMTAFHKDGIEGAKKMESKIRAKNTPLYKVLNSDDKNNN